MLLAVGFRPGQASPALVGGARGSLGAAARARAARRGTRRSSCSAAVEPERRRVDLSRRRRQSVLPRAAAPLPRGRPPCPDRRRRRRRGRGDPGTRRRRGLARRGARVTAGGAAVAAPGGGRRRRAVRARPRGLDRRARRERRRSTPSTRSSSSTSSARRTVPRRFVFRHPLVRRAVYEAAPAGWRLAAHARAAAGLAARGAAPAEQAHHVEQYAARGDEAAIAVLLDAGTTAAARAPAAAARWLETALELLPASDERRVDVYVAARLVAPRARRARTLRARRCSRRSSSFRPTRRRGGSS